MLYAALWFAGSFHNSGQIFCSSFLGVCSIVASSVRELAKSKEGFLVRLVPDNTPFASLFHAPINERVQGFRLVRDEGGVHGKFLPLRADNELERMRTENTRQVSTHDIAEHSMTNLPKYCVDAMLKIRKFGVLYLSRLK